MADEAKCEADWHQHVACSANLRMFGSPTGAPPGVVTICGAHFDLWSDDGWDSEYRWFAEMVYEYLNTKEQPVIVEFDPIEGEQRRHWTLPPTVRITREQARLEHTTLQSGPVAEISIVGQAASAVAPGAAETSADLL